MRLILCALIACVVSSGCEDAQAATASEPFSCSVNCARNALTDVTCTAAQYFTTYTIQNTGDTTQKIWLGYSGMAANDGGYHITGFEYCNGCASGAVYVGNVTKGKPKCVSDNDGGVRIAVQVFQ